MLTRKYLGLLTKIVDGAKFHWQTTVKGGRALGAALLRVTQLRVGGLTRGYVGMTFQYAKFVVALQRRGGWNYVVKYTKACSVLLQQAASGHKIDSTQSLGCAVARTRAGLPRVIHCLSRKRIRSGNLWEIRLWLSLFGLYRVIGVPGKLKLHTITQGPTVTVGFIREWVIWLSRFTPVFLEYVGKREFANRWTRYYGRSPVITGETTVFSGTVLRDFVAILSAIVYPNGWAGLSFDLKPRFRTFTTSGPGSAAPRISTGVPPRPNLASLVSDSVLLQEDPEVGPAFREWLALVEDTYLTKLLATANRVWREVIKHDHTEIEGPGVFKITPVGKGHHKHVDKTTGRWTAPPIHRVLIGFGNMFGLGKLGFKTEPAGKIRVFAMVDALTQMLLGPLHDAVFNILRVIPQDGTFDQMKPAERLISQGLLSFWSYDLSAATDRFPVSLQQAVLGILIGPRLAQLWVTILDRTFRVPQFIPPLNKGERPVRVPKGTPKSVKYGAGQPMGALTSWAVFALTHHFLVQFAAYKATGSVKWFESYALLGDDIVIADKKVARGYLSLLQEIGVGVGLEKSLISSSGGFEFAKRTFSRGQDVSGLPLLAVGAAKADLMVLEELLTRTGVRGFEEALLTAARFLGYGYRTRARLPAVLAERSRLQGLAILLLRPMAPFGTLTFTDWISQWKRGNPAILGNEALGILRESLMSRLGDRLQLLFNKRLMVACHKDIDLSVSSSSSMVFGSYSMTDRQSLFSTVGSGPEYRLWLQELAVAYIDYMFEDWDDIQSDAAALKAAQGPTGDLDDAYLLCQDLMSRIENLPTELRFASRPVVGFGAKRRASTVRLWRATQKLVRTLKD